ncbi:type II toxin-antitoxin system RatA family toxin [Hwanghaeella sp.]|uniref:type II toxin-antitoxin system RatA family toxin n=1 Tax=Hwanghaeella sp. TaxID=2605943 RepID=UPI003CCC2F11
MPRHAERRPLPHTPEQLFDLVADVDRYPEFLPWCTGVRVRQRSETLLVADLVIGFKGITERFTSRVHLDRPNHRIQVEYEKGPFKYLHNQWKFEPSDQGAVVDFYVEFEFRSKILEKLIGMVFTEAVRKMVVAFEHRADALYPNTKEIGMQ